MKRYIFFILFSLSNYISCALVDTLYTPDSLLTNTQAVIEHILQTKDNYCQDRLASLAHYESISPLLALKTTVSSHYDIVLRDKVSQELIGLIKKNHAICVVRYIAYGIDTMWQDFLIFITTFSSVPDSRIDYHIIDAQYADIVALRTAQDKSAELTNNLLDYHAIASLDIPKISSKIILLQERIRQLISWTQQYFPEAQLKVFLHDTLDGYLDYSDKHDEIIVARLAEQHNHDYTALCQISLSKKESNQNFMLYKQTINSFTNNSCSITYIKAPGAFCAR